MQYVDDCRAGIGQKRVLRGFGSQRTFVRVKREFVYLAVVLDRFSRKVVGWNLDRTLTRGYR
jgi:transposase InsO family protein